MVGDMGVVDVYGIEGGIPHNWYAKFLAELIFKCFGVYDLDCILLFLKKKFEKKA